MEGEFWNGSIVSFYVEVTEEVNMLEGLSNCNIFIIGFECIFSLVHLVFAINRVMTGREGSTTCLHY